MSDDRADETSRPTEHTAARSDAERAPSATVAEAADAEAITTQRSAPTDLSTVRTTVTLIKTLKKQRKSKYEVFSIMPDFCEKYPALFNMAYDEGDAMDSNRLEMMLRMTERIASGNDTFKRASEEIGQTMFDEYVKPRIPEMATTSRERGGFKPQINFKNQMPSKDDLKKMFDTAKKR